MLDGEQVAPPGQPERTLWTLAVLKYLVKPGRYYLLVPKTVSLSKILLSTTTVWMYLS